MTTTITSIERRGGPKGGCTFVVNIACDAQLGGQQDRWTSTAELAAADFATYASFKRSILKRAGLLFADDRYIGRYGAESWDSDIQHLLAQCVAREGAA